MTPSQNTYYYMIYMHTCSFLQFGSSNFAFEYGTRQYSVTYIYCLVYGCEAWSFTSREERGLAEASVKRCYTLPHLQRPAFCVWLHAYDSHLSHYARVAFVSLLSIVHAFSYSFVTYQHTYNQESWPNSIHLPLSPPF
jgi:hypothetical protein